MKESTAPENGSRGCLCRLRGHFHSGRRWTGWREPAACPLRRSAEEVGPALRPVSAEMQARDAGGGRGGGGGEGEGNRGQGDDGEGDGKDVVLWRPGGACFPRSARPRAGPAPLSARAGSG